MVSYPESLAPKLQEDLLGTKVKRVTLTLVIYIFWSTPQSGATGNPGHGTKIARGGGNFYYQYESISWFLTGATRIILAPELQEVSLYQFIWI